MSKLRIHVPVDDPHAAYVKCASELAARRMQVRALRKIAKKLYLSIKNCSVRSVAQSMALHYYEKEMK
jgi:hypothetical protein